MSLFMCLTSNNEAKLRQPNAATEHTALCIAAQINNEGDKPEYRYVRKL